LRLAALDEPAGERSNVQEIRPDDRHGQRGSGAGITTGARAGRARARSPTGGGASRARQTAHVGERRGWHDHTRLPALDGLRGVAILLVLVHHVRSVFVPHLHPSLVTGGFLGVDLFFVLSGFLITGLLLDEFRDRQGVSLPSFYRRRFMRLYPALVVLLVAHAIYAVRAGIPSEVERDQLVSVLFYFSNWRETLIIPEGTGHLWSLAVEEQFYLLWPLVLVGLLWLTHARRSHIGPIIAAGVATIALYRAWRWHDGMAFLFVYQRTDMRADALLIGAFAAVLAGGVRGRSPSFTRGRRFQWAAWVATGVLAWSVLFARWEKPLLYLGGFTVVAVACGVLALAVLPSSGWPGVRAMQWGHCAPSASSPTAPSCGTFRCSPRRSATWPTYPWRVELSSPARSRRSSRPRRGSWSSARSCAGSAASTTGHHGRSAFARAASAPRTRRWNQASATTHQTASRPTTPRGRRTITRGATHDHSGNGRRAVVEDERHLLDACPDRGQAPDGLQQHLAVAELSAGSAAPGPRSSPAIIPAGGRRLRRQYARGICPSG
jgi:peptidoglycan/LPS O-acetylase OafA/YrhL